MLAGPRDNSSQRGYSTMQGSGLHAYLMSTVALKALLFATAVKPILLS